MRKEEIGRQDMLVREDRSSRTQQPSVKDTEGIDQRTDCSVKSRLRAPGWVGTEFSKNITGITTAGWKCLGPNSQVHLIKEQLKMASEWKQGKRNRFHIKEYCSGKTEPSAQLRSSGIHCFSLCHLLLVVANDPQ
jgi:hypothetical protein